MSESNAKDLFIPTIPVGQLKKELEVFPDDWEISFSGLEYNGLKSRGNTVVQLQFTPHVYRTREGNVVVENPE